LAFCRPKRFLAADGKYGHGQLGSLEDFVVFSVLREGDATNR